MVNINGTRLGVIVLLAAVLLTYAASVDARGRGGGHSHSHSSSHSSSRSHHSHSSSSSYGSKYRGHGSSSTKFYPSLLLITGLLISIGSLNAVRTPNSELDLSVDLWQFT